MFDGFRDIAWLDSDWWWKIGVAFGAVIGIIIAVGFSGLPAAGGAGGIVLALVLGGGFGGFIGFWVIGLWIPAILHVIIEVLDDWWVFILLVILVVIIVSALWGK